MNFIITILSLLSFSLTSVAAKEVSITVEDGQTVTLEGSKASITRKAADNEDKEIIRKCGATYSAFILKKPINIVIENPESGKKSTVSVYRFSLHGSAKVEKSNSKVTGQVFQIMAGSCNDEEFGIDTN